MIADESGSQIRAPACRDLSTGLPVPQTKPNRGNTFSNFSTAAERTSISLSTLPTSAFHLPSLESHCLEPLNNPDLHGYSRANKRI